MAENENEALKKFEDGVKVLESKLNKETTIWNSRIKKIAHDMRGNIKTIPDLEADIISFKQDVVDEIRAYSLVLHKNNITLKELRKQRFEFYSTTYQIAIKNDATKKGLIEADIAKIQYKNDLLDAHTDFLRETANDLESFKYSVKNRLELLKILGLD